MKMENSNEINKGCDAVDSQIVDGTAHLNCITKTITFNFSGQLFVIDLTTGDLEDSWSSIELCDGSIYDTNFHWEDDNEEPRFGAYFIADSFENIPENIQLGSYTNFDIVEIVGTIDDYFNKI